MIITAGSNNNGAILKTITIMVKINNKKGRIKYKRENFPIK